MIRALLITKEERLASIIAPIFDRSDVQIETVGDWSKGQELLFRDRFDLVAIDYEAVKLEDLDTFVTLDNIFLKEQTTGVLMVRSKSARIDQLEEQFSAFHEVVDMSQGKPVFLRRITLALGEARKAATQRLSSSTLETDAIAQVELDLPVHTRGDLASHRLSRLAYTLRIRKESGRLKLSNGPRTLTFGFAQGQVIADDDRFESGDAFPETFAWKSGTFAFEADEGVESDDTLETVDLILRGTQKYMHQRDLTEGLFDLMQKVPIPTNLWEERSERYSGYGALNALLRLCDGKTPLEKVLAGMGSMVNEGFRAAYFALQTDLLIPQPEGRSSAAVVMYSREVRQRRQKVADTERKATKAFKAAESDSGREEVEAELRERTQQFTKASAYEVFGVWEGCGRKVVQDTFYRMVKEHHPDVYGGNISDEMKRSAQEIFIVVKNSYQELLKLEKEQTVEPPDSYLKREKQDEKQQARQRSRSLAGATAESTLGESSEAFTRKNSPQTSTANRPLHETPRLNKKSAATPVPDEDLRTTSGSGQAVRRDSSAGRRRTSSIPGAEDESIDVKERLKKLSAFKKKRARRRLTSPRARSLSENSEPVQELLDKLSESSQVSSGQSESSVPIDSDASDAEEQRAEKDRQQKLERLIRKTSQVDDPNAPNPARDAFNRGYKLYKEDDLEEALKQFSLARRFRDEGLYKTFYAYTMFRLDEGKAAEAMEMLQEVIESKHRQASADAYLFMGHILKAGGNHPQAIRKYEEALRLNPKSREAEREVRLAKMRKKTKTGAGGEDDSDSILKKIFKK